MRIAHVTATFPPYYGGTGNVCYHNARVLAARGHDVHVFTAAWPGEPDDPPGVTVHRLRPIVRVGNAPVLPQLLRLNDFDLVHLHYPFISGAEFTAIGASMARTPFIVTYHNDLRAPGLRGVLFSHYARTTSRSVLKRAVHVCGVATEHAQCSPVIQSALNGQLEKLVEVPNGVDTNRFHPNIDGRRIRQSLGISDEAFVISFVAVLDAAHHFKRLDVLLQAIASMTSSGVPIHVVIVGGGEAQQSYERLASDFGIRDHTHFIGAIQHQALPPYLAASDVLVLCSDSVESFGLVLVEALACSRPVIASELPGVRSVVAAGRDGFLVEPGNAQALAEGLKRMIMLPREQRQAMGQAGRVKVERHYDWDRIGERLESLYSDIVETRAVVRVG